MTYSSGLVFAPLGAELRTDVGAEAIARATKSCRIEEYYAAFDETNAVYAHNNTTEITIIVMICATPFAIRFVHFSSLLKSK